MSYFNHMGRFNSHQALRPPAGGFTFDDADAEAYVAEMDVEPDDTRKGLIDDLFVSLKADGVYANLTWLSLFAAHDAQAARINAITPTQVASAVNSPTFTTNLGYNGDDSTSYLDSGITASSTLTDTDMSFFSVVDVTNSTRKDYMGYNAARGKMNEGGGLTTRGACYTATQGASTSAAGNDKFYCVSRTGTTQGFSIETTEEDSDTVATSLTGNGANIRFLASDTVYSAARISVAGWGMHMTTTERSNLRTHLRTYLTGTGAI
jgi:hypothetical protein